MHLKQTTLIVALAATTVLSAYAQQLDCPKSFGFRADVNGSTGKTLCASNVDAFVDSAKNFTLSNSGYSQNSVAQAQGRFDDLDVVLRYATASTTLSYAFPQLGMSGSFTGATRDESEEQLVEFLKKSDILGKILRYQSQHSASSALTGAGGLIPMLGTADFNTGFDTASKIATGGTAGTPNNLIGVGLGYSTYNVNGGGEQVKTTSLPLSYTWRSEGDARRQVVLSMPIMDAKTGNAHAYNFGVGVAVRLPVGDHWTLTPGVRYSAVASLDRATVSTVASGSLMSTYVIPMNGFDLAVGNMIALYKTGKFRSGDYSFDPDIKLKMTRNGLMASVPTTTFGSDTAVEFSLIDTRYLGDKPYVSNSQEIGMTVGTNRNATNRHSFLRAGVSYVRSNVTRGLTVNLGYWF
jgi:hypothetical protein